MITEGQNSPNKTQISEDSNFGPEYKNDIDARSGFKFNEQKKIQILNSVYDKYVQARNKISTVN